ncbi:MAG: bifunctional nuclease family protein [bacterium]|nr:bifunctional nuclease family protein [bacterium]
MDKVQVDILGLSENPKSKGAYALVLREVEGPRRLPIVIGPAEAQAIVTELEGHHPPRPMTHDLLKNVIVTLGAQLREVIITSLNEGTFYATLVLDYGGQEIDARPSDAIALAVRFGTPIYVSDDVLRTAGFSTEDAADGEVFNESEEEAEEDEDELEAFRKPSEPKSEEETAENLNYRQRLERELTQAVTSEDYEKAAKLRDELSRLTDD